MCLKPMRYAFTHACCGRTLCILWISLAILSSQNVLGEPGRGFVYAMNAFDRTRPAVSYMYVHILLLICTIDGFCTSHTLSPCTSMTVT